MHRKKKPILRGAGGVALTCALAAGGMFLGVPMANAATTEIVVTNLALSGDGSLRAALDEANSSTNADGVSIVFDESLAGQTLALDGGADNSMYTEHVGNPAGQISGYLGPNGARFLVDSEVPVSIDFNGIAITDGDGSATAGIYVASDDVTLSNLSNVLAAEAAIAISGSNATVENVTSEDSESPQLEQGIALLDGATGTTISDYTSYSPLWSSVVVDTGATVTDTTITGLASRGVEQWGHIIVEDGAVVDGFSVADSTFGDPGESSPQPAFYFNPGNVVTDLSVTGSRIQSPNRAGLYFEGSDQTFTNTVVSGNTFGGNADAPITRVVDSSASTWSGLQFTDNDISYAGGAIFTGIVSGADFTGNSFTNVSDGGAAALSLGNDLSDVTVSENSFNDNWTVDQIHVTGTSATDVSIADNDIRNLIASVSRSGVRIDAPGSGNVVQNNQLIQEIDDTDLRADADNHWAIYNTASAASPDQQVGWQILNNTIDGFGGRDRSEAPIVHNATGKLPVIGNTFGENTRGSAEEETEESGFWFLWNVWDGLSNNTVQTYRADDVVYTGENASFTATAPEPLIGNNAATGPVTLHVYWTANDNAEEYLGSIDEVQAGQTVSIPTDHTDGFIRVQTVDANGYTSQYSAIDPDAPIVAPEQPDAPVVVDVDEDGVDGEGDPGNDVTLYDEDGNVVDEGVVDEDGNWSFTGLTCDVTYLVTQTVTVDGDVVESGSTEFTTLPCEDDGNGDGSGDGNGDGSGDGNGSGDANGSGDGNGDGSGNGNGDGSGDGNGDGSGDGDGSGNEDGNGSGDANEDGLAVTGAEGAGIAALGGVALLAIGGGLFWARRRVQRA